jgi:hypothetical protein
VEAPSLRAPPRRVAVTFLRQPRDLNEAAEPRPDVAKLSTTAGWSVVLLEKDAHAGDKLLDMMALPPVTIQPTVG